MRPRTAVAVCAAALGLGGLTGLVLPAGGLAARTAGPPVPATSPVATSPTAAVPPARPSPDPSASPTASPSPSPTPSASSTRADADPPTERDLLDVSSFADQSVTVTYSSMRGATDPRSAVSPCTERDAYVGPRTLEDLTGHDPQLEGLFEQPSTTDTADQVVATGADVDDASRAVARIAAAQDGCRTAAVGHWVYGPLRTRNVSSTRSAAWIGYYPGDQNTTGSAPVGTQPCGGLVLARSSVRFTVVHVYMCLDDDQLGGLAEAAAHRLGSG